MTLIKTFGLMDIQQRVYKRYGFRTKPQREADSFTTVERKWQCAATPGGPWEDIHPSTPRRRFIRAVSTQTWTA